MPQETASTVVSARGPRARAVLASLGWAYLASLYRSDWIRANLLLASFQREWADYGGYLLELYASNPSLVSQLSALPQGGRWDTLTAVAISLALKDQIPASSWPSGSADRNALVNTAAVGSTGVAGASRVFGERLLELAPMGDEQIWRVYNWAQQVVPQDVGAHIHNQVFEYVEGFDTSAEALPPDAQRQGVTASPVAEPAPIVLGEEIPITARRQGRGTGVYWAFAAAGVGVVALAGVLAWKKWGKKGRRR